MNLLVIRHGQAGDPAAWKAEGQDDRKRPLTPKGKKEMRRVAGGLATLVSNIDVLATSPLVRAAQTADIVAAEYEVETTTVEVLNPESDPDETLQWLSEQGPDQTIAVVGHEPHLSTLVGYLLTAQRASFVELKKGGACVVEFTGAPTAGGGSLAWLLTPRSLREVGG